MGRLALVYIAAVATLGGVAETAKAAAPLETAVFEPAFEGPSSELALDRARRGGATAVRFPLAWSSIAPSGSAKPSGFDPTDPGSPTYRWASFDDLLSRATARGLTPILFLVDPPPWARVAPRPGAEETLPDPVELGRFARAAARRYSGSFQGLPRIRYWQVWSEPNITLYFRPQFVDGKPFSPDWYRRMVNEVAAAVKSVHRENLVIAGGTAPFRDITPEVQKVNPQWGPLTFMRELLCLSKSLRATCKQRIRFDVWAHHPYTSGGPTHHAVLPDDVSLGDLPEMRRVLHAAYRAGRIKSPRMPRFWVTEFSWDSNKPDPKGVPTPLHTRWVAEGLYRMWKSGVSLVTWFLLRDQPMSTGYYQSGLYYRGATVAMDRPKPALRAFRFPVVAIPEAKGVRVWGRTPAGLRARVVVERSLRGGWRRLATLTTNRHGIFQRVFAMPRQGYVRARLVNGEKSVPFGVKPVPDRFFNPFGLTRLLEPKRS